MRHPADAGVRPPSTIRDVARAAGVSVATVSRALNGASHVRPATRQRIEDAARQLNFTPSGAARSLITRRTDTIGALLPDLHGEYFSELIRGIDTAARSRGLHLLLSSSHGDAAEAAAALRAMNGRVDGLLVMTPHADAGFLQLNLPASLPAVLIGTAAGRGAHPRLDVDNHGGALAMTRHLAATSGGTVACIAGPADHAEVRERLRGYHDALPPGTEAWVVDGDFTQRSGYAAAQRLVAGGVRPAAVFALNDTMAIGCLAGFAEAGWRVPHDVAVAGFDDIPTARYVTPPLTTVRVPIAALGARALDALADTVDGAADVPPATRLPVQLVVRRSCGAAGGRRAVAAPRARRRSSPLPASAPPAPLAAPP